MHNSTEQTSKQHAPFKMEQTESNRISELVKQVKEMGLEGLERALKKKELVELIENPPPKKDDQKERLMALLVEMSDEFDHGDLFHLALLLFPDRAEKDDKTVE